MTESSGRVDRREFVKQSVAAGLAMSTAGSIAGSVASITPLEMAHAAVTAPSQRLKQENALPGTDDWQLTYTRIDPATKYRCPWIEGYVSKASVRAGEKLDIMVSTQAAAEFTIDFYRLGYYGGKGSRQMLSLGPFPSKKQPDPPEGEQRLRECAWESSASLQIPAEWPSGVYLGKLTLVEGRFQSYVVFIVKDDRPADIVFQCSDNTWQAYNRWPDNYSLYDDGKTMWALNGGVRVSYDRPYGKYCQILDAPLSQGSGEFLLWEFPLAYWLEEHGYDVTYVSNTDVHASADCVTRGRVFLSVGHDEYWSLEQFENVKKAVASGTNVGFLSGNTCCFVSPFEASGKGIPNRIISRAGRYGGLKEIEVGRMGPFSMEGPNEAALIGARTTSPFNGAGDWIITDAEHWLFEGTGVRNGDRIRGLVGWEFHGEPASIPGLKVIAQGDTVNGGGKSAHWTATIYPGPQGNWVFNASTIYWAQGLSRPPGHIPPYSHFGRPHGPDERVKKITANFLKKAGVVGVTVGNS